MDKKIIVAIVVIVLVLVAVFVFTDKDTTQTEIINTSYSDGTSVVEASFNNTDGTVTFTQSVVGTATLPRAISASGARYANEDESIVFWEHQGELTITKDGADVFRGRVVEPSDDLDQASVLGIWVWERTASSTSSVVIPQKADAFTLTFAENGRVSGTTDCNNFSGSYNQPTGEEINFSQFVSTKKFCEGSQENVFTGALSSASSYQVSSDSLTLKTDSGDMIFKKK